MPGTERSSVYLPAPVVLPAASTMAMGLPMMEKLDIKANRSLEPTEIVRHVCPNRRDCSPYRRKKTEYRRWVDLPSRASSGDNSKGRWNRMYRAYRVERD